jgi:hypothetical protein
MLDFQTIDFRKLFASAGVPIRGIDAKPPYAPRKYADYDAVLIADTGQFIQLERAAYSGNDAASVICCFASRSSMTICPCSSRTSSILRMPSGVDV